MTSLVTFAANAKGAFRIEVAGAEPNNINRLLLTGQGDERGVVLTDGHYQADVTNIGTGDRQSFNFQVRCTDPENILRIGGDSRPRANWRSASKSETRPNGWTVAGPVSLLSGAAPSLPMLRTCAPSGWGAFTGTMMINPDMPTVIKVARPGEWRDNPLVCIDFSGNDGPAHCFVPLFSGGTLMRLGQTGANLLEMVPCEVKSAALVGSLTNSLRTEVPGIVDWVSGPRGTDPVRSLMHSKDDPWIAAAAGLLLADASQSKRSGQSLSLLAERNTWLADLGVLAAWDLAVESPDDESRCLNRFVRACQDSTIFFWRTFALGDRLLAALASSSKSVALRKQARGELGRWSKARAGAFKVGVFTGWPGTGRKVL